MAVGVALCAWWGWFGAAEAGFTDQVTVRPELTVALGASEPRQRSRLGVGLDLGWQRVAAESFDPPFGLSYGPFVRAGIARMRHAVLVVGTRVGATRTTEAAVEDARFHHTIGGGELETGIAAGPSGAAVAFGVSVSGPYCAARLDGQLPLAGDAPFGQPSVASGPAIPLLPRQRRFDAMLRSPGPPKTVSTTTVR